MITNYNLEGYMAKLQFNKDSKNYYFGNLLESGEVGDKNALDLILGAKYIITHNGSFHADEVFSVALVLLILEQTRADFRPVSFRTLTQLIRRIPIVSLENINKETEMTFTSMEEALNNTLILDLADGHYDHHKNAINIDSACDMVIDKALTAKYENYRKNDKCPPRFATFGLLWRDVAPLFEILDSKELKRSGKEDKLSVGYRLYTDMIFKMDQVDNYGPNCGYSSDFSLLISQFNYLDQSYTESCYEYNIPEVYNTHNLPYNFIYAVQVAYGILKSSILRAQKQVESYLKIERFGITSFDVAGRTFGYVTVPKAPEGVRPETINRAVAAEYEDNDVKCDMILDLNPSERDGSIVLTMIDTNRIRFDSYFMKHNAGVIGLNFVHFSGFMATFKTEEYARAFIQDINKYIIIE